ncbi:MAG: hypothetical protein OJF52_002584 [Nitrospira sp.]|nr:MAG: hypothetical protein OJF52_002584 [Nitrospira sp.]
MDLKGLIHRELGEGLTEKELASAVGVPMRTLTKILADKAPADPAVWEQFAKYFRMDADFLRSGGLTRSGALFELSGGDPAASAGRMRKVPVLSWSQIDRMVTSKDMPPMIRAEAMLETDVAGPRTFALHVRDDSMQPLFTEGEIIFVNPDLECKPGDYVIADSRDGGEDSILLRQIKRIGSQRMLHPLNRKYEDLPVAKQDQVLGKVVRLRKNL